LPLAALSLLSACAREQRGAASEHARLRPAYVRLSAVLSYAPGAGAAAALDGQRRALTGPVEAAAGRVALPGHASAGGRGGDSWIDRAMHTTEAATRRQHELGRESLAMTIERRVARYRQQLEKQVGGIIAEQQQAARDEAAEGKTAIASEFEPRLSDARLRVGLFEQREKGPLPLKESEREMARTVRAQVETMEAEIKARQAEVDRALAARLAEIEASQRATMAQALDDYREREWAHARELGEAGAERLEDLRRQVQERLTALEAVVQPGRLSIEVPRPAPGPATLMGDRSLGAARSRLARERREIAELIRWQTAEQIRAAGRARGYDIRFQRPAGADWPDLTDEARKWLQAETVQ